VSGKKGELVQLIVAPEGFFACLYKLTSDPVNLPQDWGLSGFNPVLSFTSKVREERPAGGSSVVKNGKDGAAMPPVLQLDLFQRPIPVSSRDFSVAEKFVSLR
jgi:hypothetical protein